MTTLKEFLRNKLTKKELSQLRASYDIIGDIAILEIPRELVKKQKNIAHAMLQLHRNVHVVAKKKGGHRGRYRIQPLEILTGEKRLTTEHKESGLRFRLDAGKCYFSPRLSTERMRIAALVQPNEKILVMFSGIAPYPLVLARHTSAKKIVGVELNPIAHRFAEENVRINKLQQKIQLVKGDSKKIVPRLHQTFDRILMPLPSGAGTYLSQALTVAKNKATIHFYAFAAEDAFDAAAQKVLALCARLKKRCQVIRIVRAGQPAARKFRICIDVEVMGSRAR